MTVLWLVECPIPWDQGLVRPMITEDGTRVLMCDSCGTVWCTPGDIEAERYSEPTEPDWQTGCGTHVRPGTTRWATEDDVRGSEWADLEWQKY